MVTPRFMEDPANIAREGDPETSHIGAEAITESGRRQTHAQRCLAVIRATPGLTCDEIGERTGLGRYKAAKRLSDLERQGEIVKGAPRKGGVDGTIQHTWGVPQPRLV